MINGFYEYEKAKSKLRDNGSLHAERLKKALLEYRRQHNIYEVGDDVVATGDPEFGLNIFKFEDWMCDFIDIHLRHATDAEIKAGERL